MDVKYRVFNKCRYNIGVKLLNGSEANIRPGSFAMMTEDDIVYIETMCTAKDKLFASRKQQVVAKDNSVVPLENLGLYAAEDAAAHHDANEIKKMLKAPMGTFRKWMNEITEPDELYDIFVIAKEQDLPASKLKVISDKVPEHNILE